MWTLSSSLPGLEVLLLHYLIDVRLGMYKALRSRNIAATHTEADALQPIFEALLSSLHFLICKRGIFPGL